MISAKIDLGKINHGPMPIRRQSKHRAILESLATKPMQNFLAFKTRKEATSLCASGYHFGYICKQAKLDNGYIGVWVREILKK